MPALHRALTLRSRRAAPAWRRALFALFALAVMWWPRADGAALAQPALATVPPLTQRVTDQTGTLTPAQRTALENVLADYERQRGSQIFVLMVSTTAPETIDAYSIRVADAWRAGRKGVDDGVIVLIARDNPSGLRKMRLEVGRGVQGTLTDAMSRRILQDIMAPHFRQNDFYGGLAAGISAIQASIDKENLPGPQRRAASGSDTVFDWLPVLFPLAIIVLFLISATRQRGRRIVVGRRGWDAAAGGLGGLSGLGGGWGRHPGGFGGFGGGGGGGFGGGGGGGFDGGGASGNW